MEQESFQNYELAYHITTQLEDTDVQKTNGEIEKAVSDHGGKILSRKSPEKIRLSYPIKHQQHANFGYFDFQIEDKEKLSEINEALRLNGNVLRFLMMKSKPQSDKEKDLVRKLAMENRRGRPVKPTLRQVPQQPKADVPPVKDEEIEKQIEDIIGKI